MATPNRRIPDDPAYGFLTSVILANGGIMVHARSLWVRKLSVFGVCAFLVLPLSAQEQQIPTFQPEGHLLTRIFKNAHETPPVRTLEVRGESLLQSMIREGKLEISEQDAVNLALTNNLDINVLRYTPYLQLWGVEGGKAVLNPIVTFGPSLSRSVTPSTSALQGSSVFSLIHLYSLNVHKPLASGQDLDFSYSTTRARTNSPFSSLNPSFTSVWSIGFTQHLLQGRGSLNRARFLHIARNNYDISLDNFAAGVITIVNSVLNAYWNLVYHDEDIKAKEAALKLARLTLDQAQVQAQVGAMAPLDVLQAQAQAAGVNQQLIVSRYNRTITEEQLKKMISSRLGNAPMEATVVPTSRALPPAPPAGTLADAIQRSIENRPEVKAQLTNLANSRIQVDYTKKQLLPVLDFTASYAQNGLGGNVIERDYSKGFLNAPILAVIPGGFGDSLSSLFGMSNLGYALGLNFRIPIGNNQARVDNAQAQIAHRQGEENLRALRQQITLQVRQAYELVALNQASVAAAQVAVDYQERRLQGEQDKYALGAGTTFLVLQAQRDLQNAQSVLLQARIAWIQSRIALDQAVGDTLAAHNIVVEDVLSLPKK
jgi:outer membrane protein